MANLIEELQNEAKVLHHNDFREISVRLSALLEWMDSKPEIKSILDALENTGRGVELLKAANFHHPPLAGTSAEVAAVGLALMRSCRDHPLFQTIRGAGITATGGGSSIQPHVDAALKRYIEPFLNYDLRKLAEREQAIPVLPTPAVVTESLQRFHKDYPDSSRVGFIMMRFGDTGAHARIESAIREALRVHGFIGLLAKDKDYHEDLYPNIQTYLHGCRFGVAVFERVESNDFNPNVSLEVGYMLAQRKPVLLLKDKTLQALQTDLVGKLYKPFDTYDPANSIPPHIEQWLRDREMI